jgi:kynurenine 3-monooxygenase
MTQKIPLNSEASVGIAGGGLVGSLLSIYLARKGLKTDLYEYRPDMRAEKVGSGRSINLAISVRGLYALRAVGLEEQVLKLAIPMRGRMIHSISGSTTFQSYGLSDSECIYSISRSGLNQVLLSAAEETGLVRFHFQQKVLGLDVDRCVLSVLDKFSGKEVQTQHSTIIAADGSSSVIRQQITQALGFCTQETLEYGYKELTIPAGPDQTYLLESKSLHIWPRGNYMLIALPNLDGSFTCTLFMPFAGPQSFESLNTPQAVDEFFTSQFVDIRGLIPDLESSFFSNPTGKMVTIKCHPWNAGGNALLIGDAAHAIVPFFGQGMNCGFEDCTILDGLMRDQKGTKNEIDWKSIFTDFSDRRKQDSDKIADMAVENFAEMRDKVGDPRFLMAKSVEKILQTNFPGEYVSRYFLVSFSRFPYSQAYRVGLIQHEILEELCANITRPEDVNLALAKSLIQNKLTPIMANFSA